jgi:hypothetical protein
MIETELRNEELGRHEEKVGRNIEQHQAMNLREKARGISAANQNSSVGRIINVTYFLFGALELLLALRVVLHLVSANATNGFVYFIDVVSTPFVILFASIVQNPVLGTTAVLEVTTIIAMLVWAIVAWLVSQLIWLMLSRPR